MVANCPFGSRRTPWEPSIPSCLGCGCRVSRGRGSGFSCGAHQCLCTCKGGPRARVLACCSLLVFLCLFVFLQDGGRCGGPACPLHGPSLPWLIDVMGKATPEMAVMANQAQVGDTGMEGRVLWVSGGGEIVQMGREGSGHSRTPSQQFLVLCSLQAVPGQHLAAVTEICQYLERKKPFPRQQRTHRGSSPTPSPLFFSLLAFLSCLLIANALYPRNVRGDSVGRLWKSS